MNFREWLELLESDPFRQPVPIVRSVEDADKQMVGAIIRGIKMFVSPPQPFSGNVANSMDFFYNPMFMDWLKKNSDYVGEENVRPRFLGSGVWGDVYELSNDEVLKITSDKTEVKLADALHVGHGRETDVLPKIYAMRQFGRYTAIVMERLAGPATREIMAAANDLYGVINTLSSQDMRTFFSTDVESLNSLKSGPSKPRIFSEAFRTVYGLVKYIYEKTRRIHYDLHGGNVMMAPSGQARISDLGGTKKINPE